MDLSNDLISKFVKITNDGNKKKPKEETVYGVTVEYDGELYAKLDGSDLLTPIDTTANIEEGERVTIMIKDHNATITGNITSPSASNKDVENLNVIVADKVSTRELEAEVAKIDHLIATKAEIEDLKATNAEITNLKANKADIGLLNVAVGNIEILNSEVANIQTLVNGNLTSNNIASLNLTSANTTIQNAMIKDAMIDSVTANKIKTGVLDTNSVRIQSSDGSMIMTGSIQQFKDENGVVRIQIGKDSSGNFTFILYDDSGKGILIDENGIQNSDAIADGLIVDAKVAEGANISGSKLDISSVVTEVNNGSTTIKSDKIYLDDKKQTLDVAFNQMQTSVNGNTESIKTNTTALTTQNGKINTLITENEIRQSEIDDLSSSTTEITNKYSALQQDLSGFKTTVGNTYTTKSETSALTTRVSTAESKLTKDSLTTTIGNYYTTSSDVNGLITAKGYATTSQVQQTATDLTVKFSESGGHNLIRNGHADSGVSFWSDNGGGISVLGGCAGGVTGNAFITSFPNGIQYSEWIKLKNNTHYVYQAKFYSPSKTYTGWSSTPLHYWVSNDAATNNTASITIHDYNQAISTAGAWLQLYLHFSTPASGGIYFKPFIYTGSNAMDVYVSELMLTESRVVVPWSPHPSEVYDGVIRLDKNGIKVTHTNNGSYTHVTARGFFINDGTKDTFEAYDGNVKITGTITANAGKIAGYTISGNDLVGSNVGMSGASGGGNWAFWAGSNNSGTAPFHVGHDGSVHSSNLTITGGSINISNKFKVSTSGAVTTESTITANGGLYTYQDIRGLDDTNKTGGLTLVSGTGHVAVRTESTAHSVYIQPASGEARVTYPASTNLADLRLKNLFSDQTNAGVGNFGLAQLYATNAYLEFMYGLGVIRVAEANHLYLQCGSTAGNSSTEVRCTCYKNPNEYANIRAYNVCAQNAVYAQGVNVSSDRNRKRDIELYNVDAVKEICDTPVYTYHLDTDLDEELKRIGIIMQEAPLDAIDLSGKGVDLYQMVSMLWKATQQQQEMIDDLQKQIKGE